MSGSSAWPSGASPKRPAKASSASSPTTPGWTDCPLQECGSGTWRLRHSPHRQPAWRPYHFRIRPNRADPPAGRTNETIFALQGQLPGIKVGTSITLLSKTPATSSAGNRVLCRDFHQVGAEERRQALLDSLDAPAIDTGYSTLKPDLQLGLPFKPVAVGDAWSEWPSLPELLPVAFSGVKTADCIHAPNRVLPPN